MTKSDEKKKCNNCKEWLPATEEFFYVNSVRGRNRSKDGRLYLRSICKSCQREKTRTHYSRDYSDEQRARNNAVKAARYAAMQKLARKYKEEFAIIYAKELRSRNLTLTRYYGVQIRKDHRSNSGETLR